MTARHERIPNVPEGSFDVMMVDFKVANCGLIAWAPVDEIGTSVNQISFVESNECFPYRTRELFVESEMFTCPVHAGTESAQLVADGVTDFRLPLPKALIKRFPTDGMSS